MAGIHLLLIAGLSVPPGGASPVVSAAPSILDLGKFDTLENCLKQAHEAASPQNVTSSKHEIDLEEASKQVTQAAQYLAKVTADADANPGDTTKQKAKEAASKALKAAQQNAEAVKNYKKKDGPPGGILFLCVARDD